MNISIWNSNNLTHLHVGTFKLRLQFAGPREAGHVEAIAVRIANQNVAGVRDVDAVREARDFLVADAMLEHTALVEHDHVVALEVANVKVGA